MKNKVLSFFVLCVVFVCSSCGGYNIKVTESGIIYNKQKYNEISLWRYNLSYNIEQTKVVGKIKPFIWVLGEAQTVKTSMLDLEEVILFTGRSYFLKEGVILPDFHNMQLSDIELQEPAKLNSVFGGKTTKIKIENYSGFFVSDLLDKQIYNLQGLTVKWSIYINSIDYKYLAVVADLYSDGNQEYIALYDGSGYSSVFYSLSKDFKELVERYENL